MVKSIRSQIWTRKLFSRYIFHLLWNYFFFPFYIELNAKLKWKCLHVCKALNFIVNEYLAYRKNSYSKVFETENYLICIIFFNSINLGILYFWRFDFLLLRLPWILSRDVDPVWSYADPDPPNLVNADPDPGQKNHQIFQKVKNNFKF